MTKRKRGSRKEKDSEKQEPEKVREEPETEQVDEAKDAANSESCRLSI